MQFGILGPVEVVDDDGREVVLTSPIERDLLAMLVVNAGRAVAVDRLVEELWGGEGIADDLKSRLRYHVSKLRSALQPDRTAGSFGPIVTSPDGFLLEAGPEEIDAARFEQLLAEARRHLPSDPRPALDLLEDGLALWRGPALTGVAAPFAVTEVHRLEELRLSGSSV